jgi:hypothetical protein
MTRPTALLILVLSVACGPGVGDSATADATDSTGTTTADASDATGTTADEPTSTTAPATTGTGDPTAGETTGETTLMPDPDHVRECQDGDFVCDDWGCEAPVVELGGCYKRCTPDGEPGGVDDECDEPARPFCSQVGKALGGDFSCNGCAHVCVAEAFNTCDMPKDTCTE